MSTRSRPSEPKIKYETEDPDGDDDIDDRTAQLLTPQVTLDVAQRRKPYIQARQYEEQSSSYEEGESGYDMDYVYLSDVSQNSQDLQMQLPQSRSRSRSAVKRPSSIEDKGTRAKKMYELDITLYPEAAAARASYENRLRKKAEKDNMIQQLSFLSERNKVLEEENAALKEKLLEYELNVSSQDWYLFFRSAGIRNGHDRKYATIFDENRIKPNMLLDLNEQWLRDMEITAVGDILAILKHAKLVHAKTNGRRLHFDSPALMHKSVAVTRKSSEAQNGNNGIVITSVRSLNK